MIRLAIRVARADAEIALAELLELAPAGVEEVDHGDTIEYALYGSEGELPALRDLCAAAGAALVEVTTTQVADDWALRWREFHQAVTVGGRLHVRPPWIGAPPSNEDLIDIVIDPNQAFGTGAHHTTRLCLEALLELEDPSGGFVDLGCGSGVLAIAAARLGWAPVLGIDHEHEAVLAARENAAVNGAQIEIRHGDLLHGGPAPSAPTVVANLLRPLLEHVARSGFEGEPPRVLVASGLLRAEADEIAAAFAAAHGLHERGRRESGDWAALTLARQRPPHKTKGVFVDMGRRKAVATSGPITWSGTPAWLLARSYHLAMMPGAGRRARLLVDWNIGLLFGRDTAELGRLGEPQTLFEAPAGEASGSSNGAGGADSNLVEGSESPGS